MYFNQRGDISSLKGGHLKLVDNFIYLESSVSATENNISTRLAKTWSTIDRPLVIWKLDLTDEIKQFFPSSGCVDIAIWTHYIDSNLTYWEKARRQLHKNTASWRQHPTKQLLYGHLPPITKIIKVRRTRHAGHCWKSKDKLISDVLLWTPLHWRAKVGRPAIYNCSVLIQDVG